MRSFRSAAARSVRYLEERDADDVLVTGLDFQPGEGRGDDLPVLINRAMAARLRMPSESSLG